MTTRRMVLGGVSVLVLMSVSGTVRAAPLLAAAQTPEDEAREFAALMAAVKADYLDGNVVIHDRWIMSAHEASQLGNSAD